VVALAVIAPGGTTAARSSSPVGSYRWVVTAHDIDKDLGFRDVGFDDQHAGVYTVALANGQWRLHHKGPWSAVDIYGTYTAAGNRLSFEICRAPGESALAGQSFTATYGPGSIDAGAHFPNPDLYTVYGKSRWTRTSRHVEAATQHGRCGSRAYRDP